MAKANINWVDHGKPRVDLLIERIKQAAAGMEDLLRQIASQAEACRTESGIHYPGISHVDRDVAHGHLVRADKALSDALRLVNEAYDNVRHAP